MFTSAEEGLQSKILPVLAVTAISLVKSKVSGRASVPGKTSGDLFQVPLSRACREPFAHQRSDNHNSCNASRTRCQSGSESGSSGISASSPLALASFLGGIGEMRSFLQPQQKQQLTARRASVGGLLLQDWSGLQTFAESASVDGDVSSAWQNGLCHLITPGIHHLLTGVQVYNYMPIAAG